jgi:hypothetical protein
MDCSIGGLLNISLPERSSPHQHKVAWSTDQAFSIYKGGLDAPLLPPLARAGILAIFSSLHQNASLAHSLFLGGPVLAWVESPSRYLVGDTLGRALSSCAESAAW